MLPPFPLLLPRERPARSPCCSTPSTGSSAPRACSTSRSWATPPPPDPAPRRPLRWPDTLATRAPSTSSTARSGTTRASPAGASPRSSPPASSPPASVLSSRWAPTASSACLRSSCSIATSPRRSTSCANAGSATEVRFVRFQSMVKEQRHGALRQQGPGHRAHEELEQDRFTVAPYDDQHGLVRCRRFQQHRRRRLVSRDRVGLGLDVMLTQVVDRPLGGPRRFELLGAHADDDCRRHAR